jgi:hypothetical protein
MHDVGVWILLVRNPLCRVARYPLLSSPKVYVNEAAVPTLWKTRSQVTATFLLLAVLKQSAYKMPGSCWEAADSPLWPVVGVSFLVCLNLFPLSLPLFLYVLHTGVCTTRYSILKISQ